MDPNHPNYANNPQSNTNPTNPNSNFPIDPNFMHQMFMNYYNVPYPQNIPVPPHPTHQSPPHPFASQRRAAASDEERPPAELFRHFNVPEILQPFNPNVELNIDADASDDSRNWNDAEDEALIWAYLVSGGSTKKGTDQNTKNLWKQILQRYFEAHLENPTTIMRRSHGGITNRWKRMMGAVNKWVGIYAETDRSRRSGEGEGDVLNNAQKMWQQQFNTTNHFQFLHCWEVLKHYPKWQIGQSVDDNPPTPDSTGSKRSSDDAGGSSRPDGVKKVKRKGKEVCSSYAPSDDISTVVGSMVTIREREHQVGVERLDLERKMFELMQEKNKKKEEEKQQRMMEKQQKRQEMVEQRRFMLYNTLLARGPASLGLEEKEMFDKLHAYFKDNL